MRQNAEWRKQAARLRAMPDANNGQVAGTCSRMAVCNGAEEMSSPRVSTRMNHSPPPQTVVLARPSAKTRIAIPGAARRQDARRQGERPRAGAWRLAGHKDCVFSRECSCSTNNYTLA